MTAKPTAEQAAPKRRGRKPKPADQRSKKSPRTVRLGPEHWAKLQQLGTSWLEREIDAAKVG